jgi:hypothetical protein
MAFTPKTVVYDDELPSPPPKVGPAETFVNRAVNMIPGGRPVVDSLSTAAMQAAKALGVGESGVQFTPEAQAEIKQMGVEEQPEAIPGVVDTYRDMRDTRAQRTETGSEQNPWAGRAGALTGFGLSLLAPLPKASGSGLGASVKTGAGYGALAGATDGKADLTRGEFGQALVDTAGGAALGGAFGAAGHGLMALGKRGVQALRGARADTLAQETLAAREAAEAGQAQATKAGEAERKMIGSAREMNKKVDSQRAKDLLKQARGGGARIPAGSVEDPGTDALVGMSRKARQAQQSRSKEVERFQQQMGDMDLPTKAAMDRQKYIDEMPKAAERGPNADPAGLRRDFMEQYLHQKFPNDPERVARIMRERVGPGGDVLPRSPAGAVDDAVAPSLADEAEAAMAARRDEPPRLPAGSPQEQLPLMPAPERVPVAGARPADAPWIPGAPAPQQQPVLAQLPTRRGNSPAFDVGGRPPPAFEQAPTRAGGGAAPRQPQATLPESSMAAPVDMPLPPEPATRATRVPDLRQPIPLPPPALPAGEATARLSPAPPASPAAPLGDDIQEVTRLAGPGDVGAIAAERAASREVGGFGRAFHAGYAGAKEGGVAGATLGAVLGSPGKGAIIGSILGGARGFTREMIRDPAVRARVLSAAKVHVLAKINPEIFAKMGGQLAQAVEGGEGQYRAIRYVTARKDPAFREAEEKAAAEVARMSDEQLLELLQTQ